MLFKDCAVSYLHFVIPVINLFRAFYMGHIIICFTILTSVAIVVVAAFLWSLQLSSSYYGLRYLRAIRLLLRDLRS